ncbi:MAG TPA: hypothetical protein V6C78_24770 [Crinalium sp.]
MQIPRSATPLKSAGTANILLPSLQVRLGLAAVSCGFSLLEVVLPFLYEFLALLDGLVTFVVLLVDLLTIVLSLIWLYQVHSDLKRFYSDYPITPGESLARFMIPFYNIWGIWNTLATIAGRLKSDHNDEIRQQGEIVQSQLPLMYIVNALSIVLTRAAFQQALNNAEAVSPVILLTTVVNLGLAYILLDMGKAMIHAMNLKASSRNTPTYTVDDMPPTVE